MTMMRWDPFREMVNLRQAVDRLFEDSFARPSRLWSELRGVDFAIDLFHTADDVVVKASLPGVKPEEVDISITGDTLTIKGEHAEEAEVNEDEYFRKERTYGAFSRSITIPVSVQSDKAEAVFENGVLTLTLPKAEEVRPKQITVRPKAVIEGAPVTETKPKKASTGKSRAKK